MVPAQDIRDRLEEFVGQHITIYHDGARPVSGRVHKVLMISLSFHSERRR